MSPFLLAILSNLITISSSVCSDQCNNPICTPAIGYPENMQSWKYGQCIGWCHVRQEGGQAICGATSDWSSVGYPLHLTTDCRECVGFSAPTECHDNCRKCPPTALNQQLFKNGICTGICKTVTEAPEYTIGFCQPIYFQGIDGTLDCSACTEDSVTTVIHPDNSVPQICIDAGMTTFGGYGYNLKHCSVSIDSNYCDMYQELNGDPLINPSGTCREFCEYFGMECVSSWGDPDNGCPIQDGWNNWPTDYTCDTVGDPPFNSMNIGSFSPDQICRCKVGSTTTTTKTPTRCEWERFGSYSNAENAFEIKRTCSVRDIESTFQLYLASISDGISTYNTGEWDSECVAFSSGSNDVMCTSENYGDVSALSNTFTANNDKLQWKMIVFQETGVATVADKTASVRKGAIKFGININEWIYSETLVVCLGIDVSSNYGNRELSSAVRQKLTRVTMRDRSIECGEYVFDNELTAQCVGYDDIGVSVSLNVILDPERDNNGAYDISVQVCYEFDYCESGNVVYDPFVYYESEE
eukprot:370137_1